MRGMIPIWLLFMLVAGCGSGTESQLSQTQSAGRETVQAASARSSTYFEVSGDVNVTVDDAEATLSKNRANIWALNIVTTPASIKKLGKSYSTNLFFSTDFEPAPGKYPIEFSYLREKNTLGGSFFTRGGRFSFDTKGEAEFLEFGEQVRVRFEFQTYSKSEGAEDRQMVTVRGAAVCARGDAF